MSFKIKNIFYENTPNGTILIYVKSQIINRNMKTLGKWLDKNSIWKGCDWKSSENTLWSWEFSKDLKDKIETVVEIFSME